MSEKNKQEKMIGITPDELNTIIKALSIYQATYEDIKAVNTEDDTINMLDREINKIRETKSKLTGIKNFGEQEAVI